MDNWLANVVGDVDSLHVEIDNLNDPLVGFCFIRSIDKVHLMWHSTFCNQEHLMWEWKI
jgi:hypothetical protein